MLETILLQRSRRSCSLTHLSFFDIACQILTSTGVRWSSLWLLLIVPAFLPRGLALLDLLIVARRYTGARGSAGIAGICSGI